jgi:hypothetical protein
MVKLGPKYVPPCRLIGRPLLIRGARETPGGLPVLLWLP